MRAAMRHTPAMRSVARKRAYTWDDFIALPDDDHRELIDGELVEVEVPGYAHEYLVLRLGFFLTTYVERRGGAVIGSGYKVRIAERRGVMPDVQLFKRENIPDVDRDEQGLAHGRPDLAIEIMSPGSRRYDRIVKLEYYAA